MKGTPNQTIAIANETPRSHRVCVAFARGIESLVWFAAPGDVAREELNGPDLVAVRCTPEEAQTTKVERSQEPFTARDASGRIQLLLPTADWKFEKPLAEAVALARKDGCASIVTFILDAEKDVTTTGTALLLERRLSHTLQRYQRNGGYDDTTVGKLPAIRFDFQCQETKGTRSGIAFTIRGPNAAAACVMTFETSERAPSSASSIGCSIGPIFVCKERRFRRGVLRSDAADCAPQGFR